MNFFVHPRRAFVALAVALLVVTSVSGTVVAQSGAGDADIDAVRAMAEAYNEHADEVNLGPATGQLTNNVVNLYVTDESSGETVAVSFRIGPDKRISDVSEGENPDANLRMETSLGTVERIASSDDPAAAFRDAYATNDITIKPTGFAKGGIVKWAFWTATNSLKGLFF